MAIIQSKGYKRRILRQRQYIKLRWILKATPVIITKRVMRYMSSVKGKKTREKFLSR